MFDEFVNKAVELRSRGESFAVALVVRFEAPVSGKPGDKAIIFPDGRIWGWIGGGCSQPVVIKEALKALAEGAPRLVRITPSPSPDKEEGVVDYTMTCHSGGSLDIYIEPVLPKPHLVILGRSLVAQTLASLAKTIHFAVSVIAPGATRENFPTVDAIRELLDLKPIPVTPQTYLVVSTQGEYDEEALEQAISVDAPYVAFVVSKPKREKIFQYLREKGVASERLDRVHAPAGLQIGAVSPEEIAVSILAEIVQASRTRPQLQQVSAPSLPILAAEVKDPICGMSVNPSQSRYRSEYQHRTFYFCCAHCKQTFDRDPAAALTLSRNLAPTS
jgi:xanthine dehydrogenase accessory factor